MKAAERYRKKGPVGRNTVNHLAQFEETAVSVNRVKEVPTCDAVSNKLKNFPKTIKADILKATADMFENNKVYGKDMETKLLMTKFMDGIETYLNENKPLLQGIYV